MITVQPRAILFSILMLAAGVSGAVGQPAKALLEDHRYTEAIDQLRAEDGSEAALRLGQAHLQRGYALRDLAQLQAEVGAAYYTTRDTSSTARSGRTTAYYAARYQIAATAGRRGGEELRRLLRAGALPSGYRPRAQVWTALAQYQQGDVDAARDAWSGLSGPAGPAVEADRALAHWRAHEPLPALNCGTQAETIAVLRCRLWSATRAEDWARAASLQTQMLRLERPTETTEAFRTENGETYTVRFYDPGVLWSLAVADFRAAAAAYRRSDENQSMLLAGIAALEGRDYETAQTVLEDASAGAYRFYRAVLAEETGRLSAARPLWQKSRRSALWAQEASRYASQQDAVQAYCEEQKPPDDRQTALRLGRAALNVGRPERAYGLLEPSYPVGEANELRAIDPAYLATLARAKFQIGRRYRTEILGHLNALREEYPVASIVYTLTQGYYVPERAGGESRTG